MRPSASLALAGATFALACGAEPVPTLVIEAPSDGAHVSGNVMLVATTRPPTGIEQVEFIADALSLGVAKTTPFSIRWDSSTYTGRHVSLTARGRTHSGSVAISAPVRVVVEPSGVPLPLGEESMYALLNEGNRKYADELLQDIWDLGPRSAPIYLNPITWTEDPYSDGYWRLLFYSLRPTVNLLWAYYTTGDPAYRDKLVAVLRSFADYDALRYERALSNEPGDRYPNPANFDEDYTAAFRVMVLVNSYLKLERSGDLPADLADGLRCSLYRLGANLAVPHGFTGYYGNHGFTSAAAQVLLAANFPELDDGSGIPAGCELPTSIASKSQVPWLQIGLGRLYELMHTAVDADGVEIEHSPFYHLYVMTFVQEITAWLQLWFAPEIATFPLSDIPKQGDLMADYAAYILQPDGRVPLLGASVTTSFVDFQPDFRAAIAARYPEFEYVVSQGASGTEPSSRSRLFPESGQSMLRSGFGPPTEFAQQTFITFNSGPWRNYHNHLDVLGLTYYSAGRSLLPDSGLFTYTRGPEFEYFIGTRAHNTVVIDGQDQSQGQEVHAGLTATGPAWAYQSGSDGLNCGATHKRGVLLLQRDLALVVDHLTATPAACTPLLSPWVTQTHRYVQTWHFAPDLAVELAGLDANARDATATPVLSLVQGLVSNVGVAQIVGSLDPIQGWYSEKYGVKVPNTVLEYQQAGTDAWFATLLASGSFAGAQPRLRVDENDDSAVRVRICAGEVQEQVVVEDLVGLTEAVQVNPMSSGCD